MPRINLKAYKTIDRDNAIYFAGLFDGEGCVNICERPPRHAGPGQINPFFRLGLSLANTHRNVLQHIKSTCGGVLCEAKKKELRKDGKPVRKQWRWSASQRESFYILQQILPFLIVKRDQAALAIEFYKSISEYVHRPHPGNLGCPLQTPAEIKRRREFVKRMQTLNHRA